jgi:glycine betaine catabolism B
VGALGGFPAALENSERVFLAQGIGITPFRALLRSEGTGRPDGPDTTLIQVGTPHLHDEVAGLATRSARAADREQFTELVDDALRAHPQAEWAISGSPDFVTTTAKHLRAAGVPTGRLHEDRFRGIQASAPQAPDEGRVRESRPSSEPM